MCQAVEHNFTNIRFIVNNRINVIILKLLAMYLIRTCNEKGVEEVYSNT